MSVELVKLCDPDAHYDKFIGSGIYPDGRGIEIFSTISFKNEQYGGIGSSIVRQGGVTASCFVSGELCLANDDPLLIPKVEATSDLPEATVNDILEILNEVLSCEDIIPRSALICKGTEGSIQLSWKLTVTIRVLNNNGNLFDAVIGAVIYALAGIKLPYVKISHAREDEAPIEKSEISLLPERSSLDFQHIPVCSTFTVYRTTTLPEDKVFVLSDPPAEVFSRCSTYCTIVAGDNKVLNLKVRGPLPEKSLLDNYIISMPPKKKEAKGKDQQSQEKIQSKAAETVRRYKEFLNNDFDFEMPDLDFDAPEPIVVVSQELSEESLIQREAELFLDSDGHRNILKDKVTVSSSWQKLDIICKIPKHYAFTDKSQLDLLKDVNLSLFDSCLLTGPPLPCLSMFSEALKACREANQSGSGPSLDQCLSWLAFAAQCNVEEMVPPGEFFPDAVEHIKNNLTHPSLTEFGDEDRRDLAVYHVTQTLEFLRFCNISSIEPIDKAILLFAVSRLVLDEQLSNVSVIQDKTIKLISHILVSSVNPKEVVWEFGQLLPNLCDDMRGLRTILNLFRQANAPYPTVMCLLCFIFVHISERGEWAPSQNFELADDVFVNEYAEAIKELLINVLDLFKEEKSQQAAVISLLDSALHPSALPVLNAPTFTSIKEKLRLVNLEWRRGGHTDDAILETMINNLLIRTNETSTKYGFDTLTATTDEDDDDEADNMETTL